MDHVRPRKRGRRLLWFLGGPALLLFVLALGGSIYQERATAADRARHTPPGELVAVDGRSMHLDCRGDGDVTVILDAGQGGWSSDWVDIIPRLRETTRVCAYDRAGYGWSDPAPGARDPQTLADDLAALLDAADEAPPYALVGFSSSGLSARLYAAAHPDEVAGLVLIDPATEFDNELLGAEGMRQQRAAAGMFGAFEAASRIGLVRALDPREIAPYAPFIAQDPAQPDVYFSFVSEPRWWATSRAEFEARLSDEVLAHVKNNGAIPDIPVVVVAAEASSGNLELDAARRERLQELAERSTQKRFTLAEGSSHDVVSERPELVVEAILEVVDSARAR